MDSFEKMYSVKEVAAITGWSSDTIRRRIDAGIIKAKTLPPVSNRKGKGPYKPRRVSESEVRKFMKPDNQ
jgi:hypothetical protein